MARPHVTVWIAFTVDPWDEAANWDNPFAPGYAYTEVSSYVLAIPSIMRGRSREGGRFEAGTATVILDNDDGRFSPANTDSPYAAGILPMRKMRIAAQWDSTVYWLFTGYITRWQPGEWDGLTNRMTLECVDGFKRLAQQKITFSNGSQNGRARLLALLDEVGWFAADRDTEISAVGVTSVALVGQPPLAHMHEVNDAEDGQMFVAGSGAFTFQSRNFRISNPRAIEIQATFGMDNHPALGWIMGDAVLSIMGVTTIPRGDLWVGVSDELPYSGLEPSYDDQFLCNDAQITAAGGSGPQIVTDAASQVKYGVYSKVASYILTDDSHALARATWMVYRNKDARYRFLSLDTSGHMTDDLWPHVLGLEISDRVAVLMRPGAGAPVFSENYIEAVTQTNVTLETWETRFSLSPALNDLFWILDAAGRDTLGESTRLAI